MKRLRQRLFPLLLGLLPVLVLADLCGTVVYGFAPQTAGYVSAGLALAVLAALAGRPHGRSVMLVGGAAFALVGGLLAYWPHGLKSLHRAAGTLRVGMTHDEVAEALSPSLELCNRPWPDSGSDFELWYGDCSPGLRECRIDYDPSGHVARVTTRFETGWSDFGRLVASNK